MRRLSTNEAVRINIKEDYEKRNPYDVQSIKQVPHMVKGIKRICYITYLLAAIVIVPEISLRILGFHGESDKRDFIQYDKKLGWSLIPNANVVDTGFEWKVHYSINEDGFREISNIGDKSKGVYRILILGDSFTEGYGVEQDERFSYLAENLLNEMGKKVEVINAGVRAYNFTQYHILLQSLYPKYRPDLVVVATVNGDLDVISNTMFMESDIVCRYYKPYYSLEYGQLVLKGVPPPKPDTAVFRTDKLDKLKAFLRRYSALYGFLRITSDNNAFLKKIGTMLRLKKNTAGYLEDVRDASRTNRELNEKVSAAIIKEMYGMLNNNGSSLLIFLLRDDQLNSDANYYERLSGELGFLYADFYKLCLEYRKTPLTYLFRFDRHFNKYGNELAAKTLVGFLTTEVFQKR